jgi:hypothetical protein
LAETVLIPAYRGYRGAAIANHPVVLFNERQTVNIGKTYRSGRVGADMIAEGQHIPRSLWNDHLISFQQLSTRQQRFPGTFNRRIIAVAHGDRFGGIELQTPNVSDNAAGFVTLIERNEPLLGIDRIDLCVCNAARKPGRFIDSLAERLRGQLDNSTNPNITGWASDLGVSPAHPLGHLGTIQEGGGSGAGEILHAIFPIGRPPGGAAMPAPGGAGGMWREF